MKSVSICGLALTMLLAAAADADAADGKISGYTFGDYYYVASGAKENENGFQIRRIYFAYDTKWNAKWFARVRLEMSDPGFGSNSTLDPFVKDAYLRYTSASGRRLVAGLSSPPTFSLTEDIWAYRSVEKTMLDLNRIGSSRDFGLSFQSKLDASGRADLTLMAGNGNSNRSEGNNGKKLYARLHASTKSGLGVAGYADWENRPGDTDRTTVGLFLYRKAGAMSAGLEGFMQSRKGATDIWVKGISAFAHADLQPNVRGLVRADYVDPGDAVADDESFRVMAGVDVSPEKDIHIIPNVLVNASRAPGVETEFIPRVTLFYTF